MICIPCLGCFDPFSIFFLLALVFSAVTRRLLGKTSDDEEPTRIHTEEDVELLSTEEKWKQFFEEDSERVKVLYYSATWCGPCKSFFPRFANIAYSFKNAPHVAKVDVDEIPEASGGVKCLPTVRAYKKNGKEWQVVGDVTGAHVHKLKEMLLPLLGEAEVAEGAASDKKTN
eukprot:Trichotokara_eunicae@DN6217_c0_g1_i1.p1